MLREKLTVVLALRQAQLLGVQELEGPSESSHVGLRPPGLYSPRSLSQGMWEGEVSTAEEVLTSFLHRKESGPHRQSAHRIL